jgi:L-asparagine transporter-like permease
MKEETRRKGDIVMRYIDFSLWICVIFLINLLGIELFKRMSYLIVKIIIIVVCILVNILLLFLFEKYFLGGIRHEK